MRRTSNNPVEVISAYLRLHAMTPRAFADMAGLSESLMSRLLSGQRRVTYETALVIAPVLGVDASALFQPRKRAVVPKRAQSGKKNGKEE